MNAKIKEPTTRKVKNRGKVPMRYKSPDRGQLNGWIETSGKKWIMFWSIKDHRLLRLPVSEEQFIRPIADLEAEGAAAAKEAERKRLERLEKMQELHS